MEREISRNVTTKDGELTSEMKDYIHEWVKKNSKKIQDSILKRIFDSKS